MTMRILSWPAKGRRPRGVLLATAAAGIAGLLAAVGPLSASGATADAHGGQRPWFLPGNLVLSGSYYTGQAGLFTPGVTELPPGCTGAGCTAAVADGSYPYVFNNDASDRSFGITSPIFLDQITPDGRLVNVLRVPDGDGPGGTRADHVVTSFSSKSELALNLSTDGRDLTFMGYYATPNTVDVSNANTPGAIDPTNPVPRRLLPGGRPKWISPGRISYTQTNAYSGDNGRAAILNNCGGDNVLYMAGNAGNGSNPQPDSVISGAGAQITTPQRLPESEPDAGRADAGRQLQRHAAGRHGRQDRQGHELPRPDDLQQRRLLHQGQRQQRHQHRLLHRHHRQGLPERRRGSAARREAAHLADRLQPRAAAERGRDALQHVHPEGLPDHAGQVRLRGRVPVRALLRQRGHAVRGRRGERRLRPTTRRPAATQRRPRRPRPACRSGYSTARSGTSPTRSAPA